MATLQLPISKAGKGVTLDLTEAEFQEIQDIFNSDTQLGKELLLDCLKRGLAEVANSRMGKEILAPSKLTGKALEDNKAAALAKARQNIEDYKAGKLLKKTTSKSTVPAKVLTEARRLAREVIKDTLKANKVPLSQVAAKDITALATKMVADDPSFVDQAKINLAERETAPKVGIDILAFIKRDPVKVAKAEAEKAERAKQLSAKQAGLPKKGQGKVVPSRKGTPVSVAAVQAMTAQQAEAFHSGGAQQRH